MPTMIYGPAVIVAGEPVTLYAGRGALALATYLGLTFPAPGEEIDAASLEHLGIVFGPGAAPRPARNQG
jgi:hypothetical protein